MDSIETTDGFNIDLCKLTQRSAELCRQYVHLQRSRNATAVCASNSSDAISLNYLLVPGFMEVPLTIAEALQIAASGKTIRVIVNILSKELVARGLGISSHDLSRLYRHKSLGTYQSEIVIGLYQIWGELIQLFNDQDELVIEWLSNSKRPLNDKAPIDLIRYAAGRDAVHDLMERMKSGDFS
ncbi:hypothetical protein ST37_05950 [Vibrio sp. qd031]|uniref:antitoxin Xre/MbcA/ParS toxin-binding domain-containing protein n=1 Tax=Vibrio sp. qd031 TaxID=1603038 RepID=UPI000A22B00F|nr:antitoxin Xre/MbcA/ParS toxin-binding domain-containing protein [Vibrio sp. qd031]ORT50939.1 hypothetical protein ST37_05950 [Vibrio sp. qd031]